MTPEDDLLREASERLTERIEALFDEVDPATHDEISQFTYEALATRLSAAHQPADRGDDRPLYKLMSEHEEDAKLRASGINAEDDGFFSDLCERVGYGRVMDAAARLWRRKDPVGAQTTGPCVIVLQQALEASAAHQPADMRAVAEALGFEPDNHHNALKCPYCNPEGLTPAAHQPAVPAWGVSPWPDGAFGVVDPDPSDDHGAIYLLCPGGLMVNFSGDATPGLDAKRVQWIADKLNGGSA